MTSNKKPKSTVKNNKESIQNKYTDLKGENAKEATMNWDILGSYTGVPEGGGMPSQDADDL